MSRLSLDDIAALLLHSVEYSVENAEKLQRLWQAGTVERVNWKRIESIAASNMPLEPQDQLPLVEKSIEFVPDPQKSTLQASAPPRIPAAFHCFPQFVRFREKPDPCQIRVHCCFPDTESHRRVNRIVTLDLPAQISALEAGAREAFKRADLSAGCTGVDGATPKLFRNDSELQTFLDRQKSERLPSVLMYSLTALQPRVAPSFSTPESEVLPDVTEPPVLLTGGNRTTTRRSRPTTANAGGQRALVWHGSQVLKTELALQDSVLRQWFATLNPSVTGVASETAVEFLRTKFPDFGDSHRMERATRAALGGRTAANVNFEEFSVIVLKLVAG